ncbi:MAG: MFS transporter [Betaproteobacteria bacterium]|nr:MAG: MFS transporter [Betaproteobacteria bacterium]
MSTNSSVEGTAKGALSGAAFAGLVFAPFGLAYVISYGLRTVNAAIAPQLTTEFGLNAAQLGLLTAAYFLSFAFTQLPLGGWLDRYRPRRVEALLLLSCAAGCFIFASASSLNGLIAGRIAIGVGVSACLMATLRTFAQWLPPTRLPAMNGYMLALGNAGAVAATAPVLWLLQLITWQQMFFAMGVITLLASLWLAFAVPDPPSAATTGAKSVGGGWGEVLKHPLFWTIAPITCFTNAVGLAVQGLWAGPWLVDVVGMAPKKIGDYLMLISAAMIFANIVMGKLMGHWVLRGKSAPWFAVLGCVGALLGQLPFLLSWVGSPALALIAFGVTHVCGNLVFAALMPLFPSNVGGRLSTLLNFLMFGTGFLLQWGIGLVVNQYPAAAAGRYLPQGYESAFLLLLIAQIAIVIWTFWALRRHLPSWSVSK